MTKEELAAKITGTEYGTQFDPNLVKQAASAGLVICYGASDDLLEFEGAISDEIGAYQGCEVEVDAQGLQLTFEQASEVGIETLRRFFQREGKGKTIEAVWSPDADDIEGMDGYSWLIRTEIPHATFEIVEDGEPFCRGVVFALVDATP